MSEDDEYIDGLLKEVMQIPTVIVYMPTPEALDGTAERDRSHTIAAVPQEHLKRVIISYRGRGKKRG